MDNMIIWDQVSTTDPSVTKPVSIGAKAFTAICPQAQIKRATELWGPMGSAWGVRNAKFQILNNEICLYTAELFYPSGKKEGVMLIQADETLFMETRNGRKYRDDWSKIVATDALTKGLSRLGFNSDVFEGKFDDNKYVSKRRAEEAAKAAGQAQDSARGAQQGNQPHQGRPPQQRPSADAQSGDTEVITKEEYDAMMAYLKNIFDEGHFTQDEIDAVKRGIEGKRSRIILEGIQARIEREYQKRKSGEGEEAISGAA